MSSQGVSALVLIDGCLYPPGCGDTIHSKVHVKCTLWSVCPGPRSDAGSSTAADGGHHPAPAAGPRLWEQGPGEPAGTG